MRVLGLDPGYGILGYGLIDQNNDASKLIEYGAIKTLATMRFPERLKLIGDKLNDILNAFTPDEISIEELFFQKNAKTAMLVAQARGVILYVCENAKIPLFEYTPLQVKQALTGYGRAEKQQIQEMVRIRLKLDSIPKPDDAADALAIALTHVQTNQILANFRI